ncbi:hypothetical protein Vadar_025106 [Vaccinium darrowii]|uniref:Uncharacterized protein n=1 Tax=Vaccinium darrowii TaxID=229202 RepID=A0ACB7YQP7_9ERIC|nr:hypothetical protein Vadar_025106 [Vaccinium darrowii]
MASPGPPLDWASLHEDLLDLILNKLIQLTDYFSFTAVCKPWQAAALPSKRPATRNASQTSPVAFDTHQGPEPRSAGIVQRHSKQELSVVLFNPFSDKTIRFPPVTKRPDTKYFTKRRPFRHEYQVHKVVLSCDPSLAPNDFVAFAIYGEFKKLAYIKLGENSWTYLFGIGGESIGDGQSNFDGATYYQGRFFVTDQNGQVIAIDVSDYREPKGTMVVPPLPCTQEYFNMGYLVQSSKGELLQVQRFLAEKNHETQYLTSSFKVFKPGGFGGGDQKFLERVEIKSLGDDALFLGDNNSQSVSATHFSGDQGNRTTPSYVAFTDTERLIGDAVKNQDYGEEPVFLGIGNHSLTFCNLHQIMKSNVQPLPLERREDPQEPFDSSERWSSNCKVILSQEGLQHLVPDEGHEGQALLPRTQRQRHTGLRSTAMVVSRFRSRSGLWVADGIWGFGGSFDGDGEIWVADGEIWVQR